MYFVFFPPFFIFFFSVSPSRSRTTLRISSFVRRYLPFKATLLPFLRVLRVLSSTSFSRSSLRAKIASVSRSLVKSIKSRIRFLTEVGISPSFCTISLIWRRLRALGVRGLPLALKIRDASLTWLITWFSGEGVRGGEEESIVKSPD
jgi:hypothetical protein